MKHPHSLVVLAALVLSCGGTSVTVRGQTCAGCLDAQGFCLLGTTEQACGTSGAACVACTTGQSCGAGACLAGGTVVSPDGGTPSADGGVDDCSAEARLVYVVDQNRTLSSFNPRAIGTSDPFVEVGHLGCAAKAGAEPFSMAVDRNATAWIIYDSGELFTADVRTQPLACVKTSFAPQGGVAKFGMGFVSNAAGSHDETLFIAGSELTGSLTTTRFGTLETVPPYRVSVLGTLAGAPEISGTGDGKLWAFFPNVSPPRVAQLSKAGGSTVSAFLAPQLTGAPRAWAFAFWGGDFFLFLERDTDLSTNVWKLDGQTGALTNVVPMSGRRIVGAGVSTCAPVQIN